MTTADPALPANDAIDQPLRAALSRQRSAFLADQPVTVDVRRDRLRRGLAMVLAHRDRLHSAIRADFDARGAEFTLLAEIFATVQVFKDAEKSVARWMRPERRKSPPPFSFFGAKAEIQYQPLGVVGIMSAWNAPVNLVLVPLATALAAGNRAMLSPSDRMPRAGAALDEAVREWFDPEEVTVAWGGIETSRAFSSLPFDKLLFTGSPRVGALVARAAAEKMVPVTLELGGKCPVVVAPDADLEDAARRIVGGKTLNGGQACLSPDRLLVPRGKLEELIRRMDVAARELYPDPTAHPDYCGIIDDRQWARVTSLLEEAREGGARIVPLGVAPGAAARNDAGRRLAIHLVIEPPAESRAMHEEIFGPVIAVSAYDEAEIDTVCRRLREAPKPLGLYVFGKDATFRQHVLDRTFSGGVSLNDVIFHYSVPDLPFGGVGTSGTGSYSFGIEGFRCFSHARSVYRQAGPRALLRLFHPPYGKLFDWVIRGDLNRMARRYAGVAKRPGAAAKSAPGS